MRASSVMHGLCPPVAGKLARMFALHDLQGTAFERGRAHGQRARAQVQGSRRCYAALFASCGVDWDQAQARAAGLRDVIGNASAAVLEEIEGIAAGSGCAVHEILALNCRTEILPPAPPPGDDGSAARRAQQHNAALGLFGLGECTALAVQGSRCADGHTRVAQNWDWLGAQRAHVLLLRVRRTDGPDYLTLTEAGIVAKIGINAAGLAVGLNILRAHNDRTAIGVPVHVFQRLALDAADVPAVLARARGLRFAASSNAILGDAAGHVAALEYSINGVFAAPAHDGVVAHANHFLGPDLATHQLPPELMYDTLSRFDRARAISAGWSGPVRDADIMALLRDESGDASAAQPRTTAICRWPDTTLPAAQQVETVCSVLMDCTARTMWVAPDIPSRTEYHAVSLDFSAVSAQPA